MRYVFLDTETTGRDPDLHRIIQIGAVAADESWNEIGEPFEVKIQLPDADRIDPEALAMNSYDEPLWREEAVAEKLAVELFDKWVNRYRDWSQVSKKGRPYRVACVAGHNLRFDLDFLWALYGRHDSFLALRGVPLDTMHLAAWKWRKQPGAPQNMKLETLLCKHLGVQPGGHDALGDARSSLALVREVMAKKVQRSA